MFSKKARKSGRSFSMMLAEEILRAELKKLYGEGLKFFQCDIITNESSPLRNRISGPMTTMESQHLSDYSREVHEQMRGKEFSINAIVGPFERLYPENPPNDKRRRLRRVEAVCRVFDLGGSAVLWRPHYLMFNIRDEYGEVVEDGRCVYETGVIPGWDGDDGFRENPCQDMCDSQISVNYPRLNKSLHGIKE